MCAWFWLAPTSWYMQLCFLSLPVSPLIPAPWGLPKQKKIGTKIYKSSSDRTELWINNQRKSKSMLFSILALTLQRKKLRKSWTHSLLFISATEAKPSAAMKMVVHSSKVNSANNNSLSKKRHLYKRVPAAEPLVFLTASMSTSPSAISRQVARSR